MKAYFVHDVRKGSDMIVVPELDALVKVDRGVLELFIGVKPDFRKWRAEPLKGLQPQQFGRVVATRDDDGDVCLADADLWRARLAWFLDKP